MRGVSSLQSQPKEIRNLENCRLTPDSGALGLWCECKIRRVHVSNNGIPRHYSDDTGWKGNVINSPARVQSSPLCVFK